MGKYNGAVITAAGQNLIAQAIAESKTVTFTTAQASSHVYPSSTDFEALTALMDVEKTVDINYAGVYSDTVVQVSARFDNDGVDTAYLINTLGFFAQLGTDTPILFAVSTAVTPDQMPVFDADNPSAFIYNMQMTVQNADSINLSVNPAGTVTVEQLNATVSTINAKIGDLSNLTTTDKSSVVDAINEVDAHADAAQASANIVQGQVSNSGDAYDPTRPYKVGELCIYNNALYRCITACSAGSWATNQSCFVVDTLTHACRLTAKVYYNTQIGITSGWQLNNVIVELINGHEVFLLFDIVSDVGLGNRGRLTILNFIPQELTAGVAQMFPCMTSNIIGGQITGVCGGFVQSDGVFVMDNFTGDVVKHIWVNTKYELS